MACTLGPRASRYDDWLAGRRHVSRHPNDVGALHRLNVKPNGTGPLRADATGAVGQAKQQLGTIACEYSLPFIERD